MKYLDNQQNIYKTVSSITIDTDKINACKIQLDAYITEWFGDLKDRILILHSSGLIKSREEIDLYLEHNKVEVTNTPNDVFVINN